MISHPKIHVLITDHEDKMIRFCDLSTHQTVKEIPVHADSVSAISLCAEGN